MNTPISKLEPSVPVQIVDPKQRLKEKINNKNSFNISIDNIKKMITYFKDEKCTSRMKNSL